MREGQIIRNYLLFEFLHVLPIALLFPVYVIFLTENDLSLGEVGWVNASFMIGVFVFEIPTGVVADIWGRKKSVLIGLAIISISLLVYYLSYSFVGFVLAEIIMAFGLSFISGAIDAWIKDSLSLNGHEASSKKIFPMGAMAHTLGSLVGGVVGGLIALESIRIMWLIAAILVAVQIILFAWLLDESYFQKKEMTWQIGWQNMKQIAKDSVDYGMKNKVVWGLIIICALTMMSFQGLNMNWSLVAEEKIGRWSLSLVWLGITVLSILGAWASIWLVQRLNSAKIVLLTANLTTAILVLLMLLIDNGWYIMGLFVLHEFPRGFFMPTHKTYLHEHIPSDKRATVASFSGMISIFGSAIGWLLSGYVAEEMSIMFCWFCCGLGLLLTLFFISKLEQEK